MKKYAKVINEEIKACEVGLGTDFKFYQSNGMEEMDVELAYNGSWYLTGYTPKKPEPTDEEQRQARANAYAVEVDPVTAHIQRLRDTNPITEEVEQEIAKLIAERSTKVAEIKQRYPYSEDTNEVLVEE